jgi:dTDP-glucose 4,6-dehydratase
LSGALCVNRCSAALSDEGGGCAVTLLADIMGKPLKYELVDWHQSRPGHDPRYGLDGSKLRALGWKVPLDFEVSLRKTVEWTLAHDEWLEAA